MTPLIERLTSRFIDHYYPTMLKHQIDRPKREMKNLMLAMIQIYNNDGVEGLKRAIVKNYKRHLGEEIGEREGQDFILSVKELLAELTLTEGA